MRNSSNSSRRASSFQTVGVRRLPGVMRMRNRTRIRNFWMRVRDRIRNRRMRIRTRICNSRHRLDVRIGFDREHVISYPIVAVVLLREAAVRRCAVITASDRNSSMVRDPLNHSGRISRTAQPTMIGQRLTSWRISRLR